jgi:hypothetical protein
MHGPVNMHSVFGNFIKEVGLRFFSSCVGGGIL